MTGALGLAYELKAIKLYVLIGVCSFCCCISFLIQKRIRLKLNFIFGRSMCLCFRFLIASKDFAVPYNISVIEL